MTAYQLKIKPWAVYALGTNEISWHLLARFKSRSDAEGYINAIKKIATNHEYKIVYGCF